MNVVKTDEVMRNNAWQGMAVIADLGADDQTKADVARGQVAVLNKDNEVQIVSVVTGTIIV